METFGHDVTEVARFITALTNQGNLDVTLLNEYEYIGIMPFMFTHAIIIGSYGDASSYNNRWCFHDYALTKKSLEAFLERVRREKPKPGSWGVDFEPDGWHRHPLTGRRREIDEHKIMHDAQHL